MITGQTLIEWGYTPGPWFKAAIAEANRLRATGSDERGIREALAIYAPPPVSTVKRHINPTPYYVNIEAENDGDVENIAKVQWHMDELMRVPTIRWGAIMPDACPAGGAKGTIPVGGVVATENAIHPGFHSANICCSMAITKLPPPRGNYDLCGLLDTAMKVTHFGPGGRNDAEGPDSPSLELLDRIEANPITRSLWSRALNDFTTQGDGNHFFYVGTVKSSGEAAIVTHHGSRSFGARVYKAGMAMAEATRQKIAPSIPKHQAWIIADSREGRDYWEALQICRAWTKENHFAIHDAVLRSYGMFRTAIRDRFWNEHNFVFQKSDGLFYHAKGATPAYPGFSDDTNGLTLIPLNMSEPILITRGLNAANGLGFAPHGAGRNFSRTQYLRDLGEHATETDLHRAAGLVDGLDVRWFSGKPDPSEMPGGYKNAAQVRRGIEQYGLAEIVDEVTPYGCIMAGHIDWREVGKRLGDAA